MYLGHRVAWFLHYGTQPPPLIDHDNRIRNDNRICNLRDAGERLNGLNAESLGYYWVVAQSCFHSQYVKDGKKIHLGLFECPLMARLAYVDALKKEQVSLPLVPSDGEILGRQGPFVRKQGCQKPNGLGYTWSTSSFTVFYRKTYLGREHCPLLARLKYVDAVEKHQGITVPLVPDCEIKGRKDLDSLVQQ